jgi:hypothetical protein
VRKPGGLLLVVVASRANSSTLLPVVTGKCWAKCSHHSSSGLHSTRLETRTKESNMYASRTVLFRLVRRNESKWCDVFHSGDRNTRPLTWTCSIHVGTRKMVIYAWARRSQGKLWWRSVAILTCKSIVRPGYRGERLIEPSSSWFLPKFPSG